ncbi:MAG: hypothetical protein M3Q30_03630 [Actinomycetota bacterium]|nr:hypothetical protein [Actinomycetota bacterium]
MNSSPQSAGRRVRTGFSRCGAQRSNHPLFGQAIRDYGLDENQFPLKVIVVAVTSFHLGLIVEGLSGVEESHQELFDWIQQWIDDLDAKRTRP